MSNFVINPENLKNKAPIIRKFLKEKYDLEISQGHSLELISRVFGFKDWNAASASAKKQEKQNAQTGSIKTVGDMKAALAHFKDTDFLDATFEFKLKEFELDPLASPEDLITQEFSFLLEDKDQSEFVSLKLKLEDESLTTVFNSQPIKEDCGFFAAREEGGA